MNPPPPEAAPPRPSLRERLRRFLGLIRRHPVRAALVLPALMLLYALALIPFTPSVSDLRRAKSAQPSVVLSADGVVLAEFKRSDRQWVTLDRIAPSVVDALIATEDRRFYDHFGIDIAGTYPNLGAWIDRLRELEGWGDPYEVMPGERIAPKWVDRNG